MAYTLYKQAAHGCDAQLASEGIVRGISGETYAGGEKCRITKVSTVAVYDDLYFAPLVNTQTDTHTVTYTDSFWTAILLAQPAEQRTRDVIA